MKLYEQKKDFLDFSQDEAECFIRSTRAFCIEELRSVRISKPKKSGGRKSPSLPKLTPEEKALLKSLGITHKQLMAMKKE